jgi:hypothetical protein
MWEAAAIVLIIAGIAFWVDSLRARERALSAGRGACQRYGVQLLDETVQFASLRRTYTFEFSDNGNNRRHGAIVMLGADLQDMQLEPYAQQ